MEFEYAVVLTGGIATGKSTVATIFSEYGFEIIDADKVAHLMLNKHKDKIVDLFGESYVVDEQVDRKALGALIFSNKKEKLILESLLHPLIYSEIERQAMKLDNLKKPYLVDIPLFFESNRYDIEKVIVVYVPQSVQLERLMKRDNASKEASQSRIDAQVNIEDKKHKATYLIDNQGNLKNLQKFCATVKDKIIADYKGK